MTAAVSRPSSDHFALRRSRLSRTLAKLSLDAILVSDTANVHYLTGFRGDDSWLLVGRRQALILSDSRFVEQIEIECPGLEAAIRKPGAGQSLPQLAAEIAKKSAWRSVGVEGRHLTLADAESLRTELPAAQWASTTAIVEEFRAIKDKEEIDTIREAVRIAERAFTVLRASLTGSQTEKSLADGLEATIRSLGGECSAFDPICAVGPRAALPHAIPTLHQCEESPLLLVDWGARFEKYNSDLTRVLVTGKPTTKLAKVYDVVLRAQKAGIDAIRPGISGGEVDRIARQVIEQAGYGRYFGHSLGHGLGLRVHEAPGLRPKSAELLRPGMVVTVEPGIYLPGWGGVRIEDDVLVTKSGHEVLTSVPKTFEENCLV